MAWEDVPAKLEEYDTLEYSDDSAGTTPSSKLVFSWTNGKSDDPNDILDGLREDFEHDLDYRIGACKNLSTSKAWIPNKKPANWP